MEAEHNQPAQPPSATKTSDTTGSGRKCPYCPSEFRKADHFHRHIRSHTKEKPFRCNICRKSYPRHDTLLRHARIHKQDSDPAISPRKGPSSEDVGTTNQDESPLSNNSVSSRPMEITGRVSTDHSTPALHSQTTSSIQRYDPELQTLQYATGLAFPPGNSTCSAPPPQSLQSELHNVASVNQFQPTMLPSPPFAESEGMLLDPIDGFSAHDPSGTSVFTGYPEISSEHWLLEDNFDFSVFAPMGFSAILPETHDIPTNEIPETLPRQALAKPRQRPIVSDLRRIWYRQILDDEVRAGSGTLTPENRAAGSVNDIDETYRDKLVSSLRPPIRDEPLPSIEFLNLCIHLFFTRFNVALPLIHGPTFRPTQKNSLLVLSICSAGCLSLGSESAARTGAMLFERVNKTILCRPWEKTLTRTSDETWNTTRVAIIGQTYALISGDPAHRSTAAAYHGSMIALARHHKLFSPSPEFHLDEDLSNGQLESAWRAWARMEELKRMAVMLYIHDAEIASLFHHEPVFRHSVAYFPTVCTHELFSAPTAASWASLFRAEQRETSPQAEASTPHLPGYYSHSQIEGRSQPMKAFRKARSSRSMFNLYNGISAIAASICECRYLELLSFGMVSQFESDLLTWYASTPRTYQVPNDHSRQNGSPFSLLPFWHYAFMTLCTNLNLLELAVGREGSEVDPSVREYALSWVASPDSKRCLLHALFLQNLIVSTKIGALVAFNTPRILFSAALCWHCYMLYKPDSNVATGSTESSSSHGMVQSLKSLPEIQVLQEITGSESANFYPVPHILDETVVALPRIMGANPAEMKAETLCVIECILRRLGTSGISIRFADIIQAFISGAADKANPDETVNGPAYRAVTG